MALGKTAKYYHSAAGRESYLKKIAPGGTDDQVNKRPEQRKKRSFLVKKRRKDGVYGKGGKVWDHKQRKYIAASVNAGQREKSRNPGYRAKMA
jgi:hypothetical protein